MRAAFAFADNHRSRVFVASGQLEDVADDLARRRVNEGGFTAGDEPKKVSSVSRSVV